MVATFSASGDTTTSSPLSTGAVTAAVAPSVTTSVGGASFGDLPTNISSFLGGLSSLESGVGGGLGLVSATPIVTSTDGTVSSGGTASLLGDVGSDTDGTMSGGIYYLAPESGLAVTLGSVESSLALHGSLNVITFGSGYDIVGCAGSDTINASTGRADVYNSGGTVQVYGGSNLLTFINTSGTANIQTGSGQSLIFGGAGVLNAVASAGSGNVTLVGATGSSAGANNYSGSTESDTLYGGSGGGTLIAGIGGGSVLTATAAGTTLQADGAGDQLFASATGGDALGGGNGGNTLMVGNYATGGDAFIGGAGSTTAFVGSGHDTVVGGSGAFTLVMNSGEVTATAGSGALDVLFAAGHAGGALTINNFNPGLDHIVASGYGAGAAQAAYAGAQVIGGSTVLSLTDGSTVTLAGVSHLGSTPFV